MQSQSLAWSDGEMERGSREKAGEIDQIKFSLPRTNDSAHFNEWPTKSKVKQETRAFRLTSTSVNESEQWFRYLPFCCRRESHFLLLLYLLSNAHTEWYNLITQDNSAEWNKKKVQSTLTFVFVFVWPTAPKIYISPVWAWTEWLRFSQEIFLEAEKQTRCGQFCKIQGNSI